jgi:hypothetical protein
LHGATSRRRSAREIVENVEVADFEVIAETDE